MKVTLTKQCLSSALSKTSGIAAKKSSMPILSNVLIVTEGPKQVQFASTDLNLSASGIFPAQVIEEGAVTLPAKTLHDIVRSMPEGSITLQSEGENVEITGGRSKFKILGLSSEDFPKLPEITDVDFFEVDSSIFSKMIDRTSFSISHDETRPHINGALFQGDGKVLRMVTTDGHRLSKIEYKMEESGFYNFSMVIPSKGISEIKKLLDEGEGKITIGSHLGSIFCKREIEVEKKTETEPAQNAELILVSKLIESDFPPYDKVIPQGQEKRVIISRVSILDALKRVSVVSLEKSLGVNFLLSEGSLEILTDNPSVGEGSELIDVAYEGEDVEIGFNARYFIDIFNVFNEPEIIIELSGELDPAVVKDLDDTFIGVVMPMRI